MSFIQNISRALLFSLLIFCFSPYAQSVTKTAAQQLPADTLFVATIHDTKALDNKCKQTSYYHLFKSSEMKPFIDSCINALDKSKADMFKSITAKLEIDSKLLEDLPMPSGQIALATFLKTKMVQNEDNSESLQPWFDGIAWIDFGSDSLRAKEIISAFLGEYKKEHNEKISVKKVRGISFTSLHASADKNEMFNTLHYAFVKERLYIGSDIKLINNAIKGNTTNLKESLANTAHYRKAHKKIGQVSDLMFINGVAIKAACETIAQNDMAFSMQYQQALLIGGLGNLTGFIAGVEIPTDKKVNFTLKGMLLIDGPKSGILSILMPENKKPVLNSMITKDVYSFGIVNYNLSEMYRKIAIMAKTIANQDLAALANMMLMATGQPDGKPPVNLKSDILNNLSSEVTFAAKATPGVEITYKTMALGFGVANDKPLEEAISRIHQVFLARGNPQAKRAFLDSVIYIVPGIGKAITTMNNILVKNNNEASQDLGFTICKNQLVIGLTDNLEHYIRAANKGKKSSLSNDPLYKNAASYLPSEVSAFGYSNMQVAYENNIWLLLKKSKPLAVSDNNFGAAFAGALASGANPRDLCWALVSSYADTALLPDFANIKKYFGSAISYSIDSPEGLYFESHDLKSPNYKQ